MRDKVFAEFVGRNADRVHETLALVWGIDAFGAICCTTMAIARAGRF